MEGSQPISAATAEMEGSQPISAATAEMEGSQPISAATAEMEGSQPISAAIQVHPRWTNQGIILLAEIPVVVITVLEIQSQSI